jgi:MarR family 2-MHQ and catechol resistance regulon transcriptional repressor
MSHLEEIFEELGFNRRDVRQPEGAIVYALARTYSLVMRRFTACYKPFGLSAASFNLLMLLERGRAAMTQRELGERLVVSPSDMTGLVDRLERKGLVRRTPGQDRRAKVLQITPKGSALVDKVWPHHAEEMTRLVRAFSVHDAAILARGLSQLRKTAAG